MTTLLFQDIDDPQLRTLDGYQKRGGYEMLRKALKIVQNYHGWCSPTAIEQAACVMRLTPAYLTAVATFYDMFELAPKGQTDVYV